MLAPITATSAAAAVLIARSAALAQNLGSEYLLI